MTQVYEKNEEVFRTNFRFEESWCKKFLKHLGRSDQSFDRSSGKRVIQTAAILARIESEISHHLGDHRILLVNIDASKGFVFLGDVLELRVYQHTKEEMIFGLDIRLSRGEDEIMQAHATVASSQAYDWDS